MFLKHKAAMILHVFYLRCLKFCPLLKVHIFPRHSEGEMGLSNGLLYWRETKSLHENKQMRMNTWQDDFFFSDLIRFMKMFIILAQQ